MVAAQIATSSNPRVSKGARLNSVAFQVPAVIHPSPLFVSCRGCGLQDGSLCADHRHRDGYPHDDLHRHREIPRHRVPAENEEAVLAQKSIQDARYPIYTLKHTVTPSQSANLVWKRTLQSIHTASAPDTVPLLRPVGLVWIASVLVGSPMLFVQQLEVGVTTGRRFVLTFP